MGFGVLGVLPIVCGGVWFGFGCVLVVLLRFGFGFGYNLLGFGWLFWCFARGDVAYVLVFLLVVMLLRFGGFAHG